MLEREQLLREDLVLPEVVLGRAAPGVRDPERVQHAADGEVAVRAPGELLEHVEHELGPALLQPADELLEVAVDREHRDLVLAGPQRCLELRYDEVDLVAPLALDVREDRDTHLDPDLSHGSDEAG